MFKWFLSISILSVSVLLSGAKAAPDAAQNAFYEQQQTQMNINYYEEHGTFRPTGVSGTGSGSLLEATQSGDSSQVCTASGATQAECNASAARASGGGSGSGSGGSPAGAATAEEIQEAVQHYVIPTSTRNFSLSNLNSQNEASLIISSGNEDNNVIFRIIRLISMLVGTVAILLYIVAGYFMIFSQGDDNSLTKGKQIITFTSLGLVIAFGAYMIVQLVMGLIYFSS